MIPHDQRRFECINARLCELEYTKVVPIEKIGISLCAGYSVHGDLPSEYEAFDGSWQCGVDEHAYFSFEPIYPELNKHEALFLKLETGASGWDAANPQALLFYDGKAIRAMDVNHTVVRFPEGVKRVDVYAYSGAEKPDPRPLAFKASMLVRDERIHTLQNKIYVLIDILVYHDLEDSNRAFISETLRSAVNALDFTVPYSEKFYASIQAAEDVLAERVTDTSDRPTTWAIGHTHIDYAWLWTKEQTKEKSLRSFGTVLSLMDEYPEYRFMSSQPALYRDVKEQDPEMYERIKEAVASGRWEAEGAMWVEPDCNLVSGESLVRQILIGKKFFRNEFGVDNKVLWLPDVFGYSAALPQILRKSGVDTFVTSKISWNEFNRMPHEIFKWQGIDGTDVDAYFLTTQRKFRDTPTGTYSFYNGEGTAGEVMGTYLRISDKHLTDEVIMPTGHGDGGGGTTPKMIEMINYLNTGVKGCYRTGFITLTEFFERLKNNIKDKKVPRWVGELYLEFHRGTYTSIAKNKRNNRKGEFALWKTEWQSVMAGLLEGKKYPAETIEECLTLLLTDQFHDILPGSSIEAVYDGTDRDYERIFDVLGKLEAECLKLIADNVSKAGVCVFNPNSFEGQATVCIDGTTVGVNNIPSKGYRVLSDDEILSDNSIQADTTALENSIYKITFNKKGKITSFADKRVGRELVKAGGLFNNIIAYEDLPYEFDNWELKNYYTDKFFAVDNVIATEVVNDGVRKGVKFTYQFINSIISQTVWMYENLDRVDFDTEIDWHEQHIVLRTESETDIHADNATYEIQYGSVSRPSHDNTPWDSAKFEVCAHKYVDVSEYGYGISLLNDCKYGHNVRDGKIGLTLLKCGTYPNPNADQGKHIFTYSLMPHIGDFRQAGVIEQAYALNNPLSAIRSGGMGNLPSAYSVVRTANKSVVIEVVKQAENGESIIIRAYESCGGNADARFELGFDAASVAEVDLMENGNDAIILKENTFKSHFRPFEIKTFAVKSK